MPNGIPKSGKRNHRNVTCKICNAEMTYNGLTASHLPKKHEISKEQYELEYGKIIPDTRILSISCKICNEKFETERALSFHVRREHNLKKKNYIIQYYLNGKIPLCKCGCGNETSILPSSPWHRNYISGHNGKVENGMFGNTHSKNSKHKMRDKAIKRKLYNNKRDTTIELKFESILNELNITYQKQFATKYGIIDFFVDNTYLIEIDGDYWHPLTFENLNIRQLGSLCNDYYKNQNIPNLIRIRESDLKSASIESLTDILKLNVTYKYPTISDLSYKTKIITKEFLKTKIKQKNVDYINSYIWLFYKFVQTFVLEFRYPETDEDIMSIVDTIPKKIGNIYNNETLEFRNNCSNLGVSFLKSKFKSYWHSKYKGNKSPYEIWQDPKLMKSIIRYRVGCNNTSEVFDFSLHQLVRGISAIRGTVSFFKPVLAAAIYKHYLGDNNNPVVLDPCAGFGGRLLGFKSMYPHGTYIGIEPNKDTFEELQLLATNFDNVILYNCRFEDVNVKNINYDLAFTSIPYYDREIYSTHQKYESFNMWKDVFFNRIFALTKSVINIPINLETDIVHSNYTKKYIVSNASHFSKHKTKRELLIENFA